MASLSLEVAVRCTKYNVKTRHIILQYKRGLVFHSMIVTNMFCPSIVGTRV